MKLICIIICLNLFLIVYGQIIPASRTVNWSQAGLYDYNVNFPEINVSNIGALGNDAYLNDTVINNFLDTFSGLGIVLKFDPGIFKFNERINLESNIIIRGSGADQTVFKFNLGGINDAFVVNGSLQNDTSRLSVSAQVNSNEIHINNPSVFSVGEWVKLIQEDSDWVTSAWAIGSVGQMFRIDSIINNKIIVFPDCRMNYDTSRLAYIQKINPVKNVGIECLKIERIDDTAPAQRSNIFFNYAVNCWITGLESNMCTFSHVKVENSSNLYFARNYFHHGFDYGGGGRAYGIALQFSSGACLVEDNVFERLRHSVLLQAGANGNVIAYNYSHDPYWTSSPNDAAGDLVLHGNYVFSNLFENNICQNIVVDNSHGPNGPFNTFFRNRAENYGIFFSASNSPDQNLVGNEITNTSAPQSFINYLIQGSGHFIYGNNNKGNIDPSGTGLLPDNSYFYQTKPAFLENYHFASIGTPNIFNQGLIPAKERYDNNVLFSNSCINLFTHLKTVNKIKVECFPNPVTEVITLRVNKKGGKIQFYDFEGMIYKEMKMIDEIEFLDVKDLPSGIYLINYSIEEGQNVIIKIIKN